MWLVAACKLPEAIVRSALLLRGLLTVVVVVVCPVCAAVHAAEGGAVCVWGFALQCYDRFMVASLSAAAQQVGQPHWGNSGPHDAGSYCQWPHQTGFFHHQGSWSSEYGRFFLQWYSSMLLQHADQFLGRAQRVFKAHGVQLHARLPTIHWWYNQAAHAVSCYGASSHHCIAGHASQH